MAPTGLTTETNASAHIALINEKMTGPPAEALLGRCGLLNGSIDSSSPLRILDNASGIGTLIVRLLAHSNRNNIGSIVGADIDGNYLSVLKDRVAQNEFSSIEAICLDQQAPGLPSESFDFISNNFGVFFAPDDKAVLAETFRMLKPGCVAGFTSWAKISWWDEILLPVLARYMADAPALPHPANAFPAKGWSDPEAIRLKLQAAGFADIEAEVWSFTPDISAEDFARACAHLVKAISARAWDEEARRKFEPLIETSLADYLNESYEGGRWTGKMSAVLTWGRKGQS